jgi:hypothetical protein
MDSDTAEYRYLSSVDDKTGDPDTAKRGTGERDTKAPAADNTETLLGAFGATTVAFALYGDFKLVSTVYLPLATELQVTAIDPTPHKDPYYFVVCMCCLTVNILGYWCMGIRLSAARDDLPVLKRMALMLPLTSVAAVQHYRPLSATWGLIFGAFPQYILNLSHVLEYNTLGRWSALAMAGSLLQLVLNPLKAMATDDLKTLEAKEITVPVDKAESTRCKTKNGVQLLHLMGKRLLVLAPAMAVEVVHFFPIMLERYTYAHLSLNQYAAFLVAFNIPKWVFLYQCHDIATSEADDCRFWWHDTKYGRLCSLAIVFPSTAVFLHSQGTVALVGAIVGGLGVLCYMSNIGGVMQLVRNKKQGFVGASLIMEESSLGVVGWIPVLLVMPLVPCVSLIESGFKSADEAKKCAAIHNRYILVTYFVVSYGSMGLLFAIAPCGTWTCVALALSYAMALLVSYTWFCIPEYAVGLTAGLSGIYDKVGASEASWQRKIEVVLLQKSSKLE